MVAQNKVFAGEKIAHLLVLN